MANVSDVIFCLRATNDEEQGASATTILTALNPEYIPGLFTFSVIITLLDIDTSMEHRLTVDFMGPHEENVVHIDSELPVINNNKESNLPQQYKGLNVAMDWNNVNLKVSGEYTIIIAVDGSLLKEKNIYVKGKNE